jgi:hypothetical protein
MLKSIRLPLLAAVALASTGCLRTLHTITADQWDLNGRAQYYVGYWEGQCLGVGVCFNTAGQLLMCRLNDDNSMSCSPQASVAEALKAKKK